MVRYDPKVIQTIARRMYDQAGTTVLAYTMLGAVIGLGIGIAVYSEAVRMAGTTAGWVALAFAVVVCGTIGLMVGNYRAAWLRFEAQTALCQVQIELNTRRAAVPTADAFTDLQP